MQPATGEVKVSASEKCGIWPTIDLQIRLPGKSSSRKAGFRKEGLDTNILLVSDQSPNKSKFRGVPPRTI